MKLTRLAALVAVPTALSLAACGGGSSGVLGNNVGTGGQTANIRVVDGSPDLGSNIDIYFQATGAAAPTATANGGNTTNVPYGQTTQFFQEPTTAGNILIRATGQPASGPVLAGLSCSVPQLANNAKYTVVVGGTGAGRTCFLFQDFDYAQTAQYRFHHASPNAVAALGSQSVAFGTTTAGAAAGSQVPYNSANVATLGGNATAPGGTFAQIQPAGPIQNAGSGASFAVGKNTAGAATFTAIDTLDSKALFASGSLTQPNTTGALNFPNTAGTSVFAIDCTPAAAATLPGVQCNAGVALIGTFDTL